jgi:hypothetical protein
MCLIPCQTSTVDVNLVVCLLGFKSFKCRLLAENDKGGVVIFCKFTFILEELEAGLICDLFYKKTTK